MEARKVIVPRHTLNRKLFGPHNQSKHFEEEKSLLYLLGIQLIPVIQHTAQSLFGIFTKVWKTTICFVLSVSPHGTMQLPLDGFPYLVFEDFSKMSRKFKSYSDLTRMTSTLYEDLWTFVTQFLLEWEMCHTKVVDKTTTLWPTNVFLLYYMYLAYPVMSVLSWLLGKISKYYNSKGHRTAWLWWLSDSSMQKFRCTLKFEFWIW